ncbi:MAG: chemotaxis protein CheB [Caulobacteraceae bacterium]
MNGARVEAIVIGASAGAVQALSRMLPALPGDFPVPILVVVHVPPGRSNALVPLLDGRCAIAVKEAEDKEPIRPGVYFAPADYHLLVERDRTLALSSDDLVLFSRPSVDVLFESAAEVYGENLLGIVLTGANDDGSAGLRAICDAGGAALIEDPDRAYAAAMPSAALVACSGALTMPLESIAAYLVELADA